VAAMYAGVVAPPMIVGGGRAALAAIAAAGHDVLPGPPRPARTRLLREVGAVLRRARREG
ncbi:hypothetical protein AB0M96_14320, partial [Streptomyces sp. NPDC051098]